MHELHSEFKFRQSEDGRMRRNKMKYKVVVFGVKDTSENIVNFIQEQICPVNLVITISPDNFSEGDFVMVQNYINSDTATVSGLKDMSTSYSEGDFTKESKQVNGTTIEYLRLTPDAKDGLGDASSDPVYLMVNADGSLTLINSELEVPSMPALYTLAVK